MKLALFCYAVAVWLLAWWPLNVWLIGFGAACGWALQRRRCRRLLAARGRDPGIGVAQRAHDAIVAGDDLDAALQRLGVLRNQ